MSYFSLLQFIRFLGGGVCHQLPARSLDAAGVTLPLCARCTGTYLGVLVGLVGILFRRRSRADLMPGWPALLVLSAFFVAWGIDGVNSYLTLFPGMPHLYEPNNTLRLLTGALQGLALSLVVWPVVSFTLWRKPEHERIIGAQGLVASILAALLIVAVVAEPLAGARFLAGLLSVLGLLTMFTVLNALLLTMIRHREGTFERRSQSLPLLGSALLLGLLELLVLSLLRHWLLGF